ncbi:MAG TPA: pyridoxal 5'-phosphate synthase glutaminase subunit PdxT [Anaerolineae bacterium]|jgi:pyridoxal 5'-phosphate synthase pdxT subunit|nr:pyridoxal 5'-phosphate synthase glutaminase subunit PdxT [Anaerolineae bacterium]
MKIGVLALQGAFIEHEQVLRRLGAQTIEVRLPKDLTGLDGLIIPGGESTTIGKLAVQYNLIDPLRALAQSGQPMWGTCAGMIFMSKDVGNDQPLLKLMDVKVQRNAFGRQVDSFEADLDVKGIDDHRLFHAVFIRAPLIESVGAGVEVLATVDRAKGPAVVAARQNNLVVTSFHPELSGDDRFHQLFLKMVK